MSSMNMSAPPAKFHAYRNKYWLPIAYCVNEDITAWSFDSDNPFEVQNDYFFRATGIDEVFNRLDITDSYFYNIDPISIGLDTGYMNYYKTSSDSTGTISFTVSPEKDQNVYLFVESAGIEDVLISVGYEQYSQNTSREYVYDLGMCKAGTPITVEMTVKDDVNSGALNFFVYGLDTDKFVEGYNKAQQRRAEYRELYRHRDNRHAERRRGQYYFTPPSPMTRAGKLLLTERKSARMILLPSATRCLS